MLEKLREFLTTGAGKATGFAVLLAGLALAIWMGYNALGDPDAASANQRVFMDLSTGKTFNYSLQVGDTVPIKAPSGGNTGYPTEQCRWTKDGKPKDEPTFVVMNEMLKKPGVTFCPDCGRRVVAHNPQPDPNNLRPPPTEAEWKSRRGGTAAVER